MLGVLVTDIVLDPDRCLLARKIEVLDRQATVGVRSACHRAFTLEDLRGVVDDGIVAGVLLSETRGNVPLVDPL